jgi:transcriptional regulator with XRE-family HTH domain
VFATAAPESQRNTKAPVAEVAGSAAEWGDEEYALRDLRRAKQVTQEQVAQRLGGRQVYVSRLENRVDMKLSTLRDYVRAIGGDLKLVVTFPEGGTVRLGGIGTTNSAERRRKPTAAKAPTRQTEPAV